MSLVQGKVNTIQANFFTRKISPDYPLLFQQCSQYDTKENNVRDTFCSLTQKLLNVKSVKTRKSAEFSGRIKPLMSERTRTNGPYAFWAKARPFNLIDGPPPRRSTSRQDTTRGTMLLMIQRELSWIPPAFVAGSAVDGG